MTRWLMMLALLMVLLLVVAAMRRGWVRRGRRQESWLAAFPAVPEEVDGARLQPDCQGLYVGTTTAGNWQDRIVVGDIGQRATATAQLTQAGLLLRRQGAEPVWIPAESIRAARVDTKLAGKVIPGAGMLVVTWRLGEYDLDTGFRPGDREVQSAWVQSLQSLARTTGTTDDGDEEQQSATVDAEGET